MATKKSRAKTKIRAQKKIRKDRRVPTASAHLHPRSSAITAIVLCAEAARSRGARVTNIYLGQTVLGILEQHPDLARKLQPYPLNVNRPDSVRAPNVAIVACSDGNNVPVDPQAAVKTLQLKGTPAKMASNLVKAIEATDFEISEIVLSTDVCSAFLQLPTVRRVGPAMMSGDHVSWCSVTMGNRQFRLRAKSA